MPTLDEYLALTRGLYEKVQGDAALECKLYKMLSSTAPHALDAALEARNDREARHEKLRLEAARFTVRFLARNPIYYTPQNELFVLYNGKIFEPCSEDTVAHAAVSALSAEGPLAAWKYKVKNSIVRRVRERSPLAAIPESDTIQLVLSLLVPSVFRRKDDAKYFLCCLGDGWRSIAAEQGILVMASPALKKLVQDIAALSNSYFSTGSPFNHFKFKFHGHEFRKCRILPTPSVSEVSRAAIWTLGKYTLEIMSVACHYSSRYAGSDGFLERACDHEFRDKVLHLVDRTPKSVVGDFVLMSLERSDHMSISQADMAYLWKQYLASLALPQILFTAALHSLLAERISWNEEGKLYINVTSPALPWVSAFRRFWVDCIVAEEDDELELEEIVDLQHAWSHERANRVHKDAVLDLIRHQDPHAAIEQEKFVVGIRSPLWNKRADVASALEAYRAELPPTETGTLGEAYKCYVERLVAHSRSVSKRYFDKVAMDTMADYLDEDGVFTSDWQA